MIHIAPSILAADFARLREEVAAVERAGANRIHVDVMDGHFVPNLSMGPVVVEGLRPRTQLHLEVHLMVLQPARFLSSFVKAGADSLIFHYEVLDDPRPLMADLRRQGVKAGMAINPDTPVAKLAPFLPELDLALCMTVHPGFSGQAFLPQSIERIRTLRGMIDRLHPACELEVDGGINRGTVVEAVAAGAKVVVVGNGIFRHPAGPAAAVKELKELLKS